MAQISVTTINWILKTIQIVGAIALPIIGWVGMNTLERIAQIEKSIVEMKLESARTSGNRFTSVDWIAAKQTLDEKDNVLDRRITKNEETVMHIKDLMVEIKEDQKEIMKSLNAHMVTEEKIMIEIGKIQNK